MQINIFDTPAENGRQAALAAQKILVEAIEKRGSARIVLSTGASQFEFFEHFVTLDIPWEKIEVFHLDEYIGLPESHPASFRKYIKERFLAHVNIKKAYLVDGEGDVAAELERLNKAISNAPVDLALIGIGENAHIAFNDPPADFTVEDPFIVVNLDEACKNQQVGEGWFPTTADVPKQAITMSVKQILKSEHIITVAPHRAKATAIKNTLQQKLDPQYPATILKTHKNWSLYLDKHAAAKIIEWN